MYGFFDEGLGQEPCRDLAGRGFEVDDSFRYNLSLATSRIKTNSQAQKYGRQIGNYVIIVSPQFVGLEQEVLAYTKKIFFEQFKKFVKPKHKKILIVGIGNEYVESDCFGPLCVNKLVLKPNIFAIKPNVFENTNILSFDVVSAIAKQLAPDLIILIDSLCTTNIRRLTASFQLTDTGVLPGGALSDKNKTIDKRSLGIDCLVVGVPSMIFACGLDKNLEEAYKKIILTPKDVRITLDYCADIVVGAIQNFFDSRS